MDSVFFFGYGLLANRERMKQIIGRYPDGGTGAVIQGYNLAVQVLDQVPENVRGQLREVWGDSFKAYTIKKGSGIVRGVIWVLTADELERIKNWDLVGSWREMVEVPVTSFDGKTLIAFTEKVGDNQPILETVDGITYDSELNPFGQWRRMEKELVAEELERLENWRQALEKMKYTGQTVPYA